MSKLSVKTSAFALCILHLVGCMDYGPHDQESFANHSHGLFIVNEGNFGGDNATLSFYNPETTDLQNNVFMRANGMKLGDVGQSMAMRGKKGYVVANNSGAVYIINTDTFSIEGLIEGVVSPRYVHFTNDTTAYITDLYDPNISVIDTRTNRIRNRISTRGHKSTEQMVQWGDLLFVNCWSYDDKILVFDTSREQLIDSIQVGPQPSALALDRHGKIWTITDGRTQGTSAALYRIDAATRKVERSFGFASGDHPIRLEMNRSRDTLYFINRALWCMEVQAESLPTTPIIPYSQTTYFGLGICPRTSQIYLADAIDYTQRGVVYRFSAKGLALDTLRVGVNPAAFCFKP